MILATWNCLAIPFELAFSPTVRFLLIWEVAETTPWDLFDNVIDLLFLIDILLTFRTTFINSAGNEIKDPRRICIEYLKGRFWVDLLATIPFDTIVNYSCSLSLTDLNSG